MPPVVGNCHAHAYTSCSPAIGALGLVAVRYAPTWCLLTRPRRGVLSPRSTNRASATATADSRKTNCILRPSHAAPATPCSLPFPPQIQKAGGDQNSINLAAKQVSEAATNAAKTAAARTGTTDAQIADSARSAAQSALDNAVANLPAIAKSANPSGVNQLPKDVQGIVSQVSQQAAEAVVKQGGTKDEANRAAQVAAQAAVKSVNDAQKSGQTDLVAVAQKAASPVVEAFQKSKDAKVCVCVFVCVCLCARACVRVWVLEGLCS